MFWDILPENMLINIIACKCNRGFEKSFHVFERGHEIFYSLEGDHEIFTIMEHLKLPFAIVFVNNSLPNRISSIFDI